MKRNKLKKTQDKNDKVEEQHNSSNDITISYTKKKKKS